MILFPLFFSFIFCTCFCFKWLNDIYENGIHTPGGVNPLCGEWLMLSLSLKYVVILTFFLCNKILNIEILNLESCMFERLDYINDGVTVWGHILASRKITFSSVCLFVCLSGLKITHKFRTHWLGLIENSVALQALRSITMSSGQKVGQTFKCL